MHSSLEAGSSVLEGRGDGGTGIGTRGGRAGTKHLAALGQHCWHIHVGSRDRTGTDAGVVMLAWQGCYRERCSRTGYQGFPRKLGSMELGSILRHSEFLLRH